MTMLSDAYQEALAAEHRALYGYALIGSRVAGGDVAFVRSCVAAHTVLRDAAAAAVTALGAGPVSPRPDYPELYPVDTVAVARSRAVSLEDSCAAAWRYLFARAAAASATAPARNAALRTTAQRALTASAVRATQWRVRSGNTSPTEPFPGIA